jgi:thymidine phosphorylase
VVEDPNLIPAAPERKMAEARRSGFVHEVLPVPLGYGVVELGGGRRTMDDPVDLRTGFVLGVRPGDQVEVGDPLGEVHAANPADLERGLHILEGAVIIGEDAPEPPRPLVRQRVPALE